MTAADRRQELQRLLGRQAQWTLIELSRDLGVSRRTIIRDLHALRSGGMNIDSDSGPGGGVRLDPASRTLRPQLKVDEVVGLVIMLEIARQLQPLPFASQANSGLRKIENSLPATRVRELRAFLDRILVGKPSRLAAETTVSPTPDNWLHVFESAFSNRHVLQIDYRDKTGRHSSRLIEPQALIITNPLFYIVGFDREKEAIRLFRADRVVTIIPITDSTFRTLNIQSLKAGCPDGIFGL